MKRLLIGLGAVVALFALIVGAAVALVESGEVVVLRTTNGQGKVFETRLWVVDDGAPWVVPGRAGRRWLDRLVANSQVELVRGGETRCHRAVPVDAPATRDRVRDLFREKYRLQRLGAVILNGLFSGRSAPADFVVRLDPC